MGTNKLIATNIRALRLAKGLSQQDLAYRTGLHVRYISRIENTAPNITLGMLERIALGLDCLPVDLFENQETSDSKKAEIPIDLNQAES